MGALGQLREPLEHVVHLEVRDVLQAVAAGVVLRHLHRGGGNIPALHILRAALRRVQGKGAGVGEAVQHPATPGKPRHGLAVELLIQEEAGLLAVLHVHLVIDAVFADLHQGALRRGEPGQGIPALALLQPLQLPDGHVVALEEAADLLPVLPQNLHQEGEKQIFDALDPHREGLRHQNIAKAIHRQAGEAVRLPEDQPAAVRLPVHHRLAVAPGVLDAPPPEGRVEAVVCVAGEQPDADLALLAEKAGAQVAPLAADGVHQGAVGGLSLPAHHLALVDPGVSGLDPVRPLGGDDIFRITAFALHGAPPVLV